MTSLTEMEQAMAVIAGQQTQIEALQTDLQQKNKMIQKLKSSALSQMQPLKQVIEQQQKELLYKSAEIKKLNAEIAKMSESDLKLPVLMTKNAELSQSYNVMQKQLQEMKQRCNECAQQLKSTENVNQTLKSQLDQSEQKRDEEAEVHEDMISSLTKERDEAGRDARLTLLIATLFMLLVSGLSWLWRRDYLRDRRQLIAKCETEFSKNVAQADVVARQAAYIALLESKIVKYKSALSPTQLAAIEKQNTVALP